MFGWWKTFEAAPLPAANGLAPIAPSERRRPDIPILKEAKAEYAKLQHLQKMMAMHKQEMEAVRADIEKMKASLAQMKANVLMI